MPNRHSTRIAHVDNVDCRSVGTTSALRLGRICAVDGLGGNRRTRHVAATKYRGIGQGRPRTSRPGDGVALPPPGLLSVRTPFVRRPIALLIPSARLHRTNRFVTCRWSQRTAGVVFCAPRTLIGVAVRPPFCVRTSMRSPFHTFTHAGHRFKFDSASGSTNSCH